MWRVQVPFNAAQFVGVFLMHKHMVQVSKHMVSRHMSVVHKGLVLDVNVHVHVRVYNVNVYTQVLRSPETNFCCSSFSW